MMMRLLVALALLTTLVLAADEQVVFRGTPTVRVFSGADGEQRTELESDAAAKNACTIVQRGRKYFWTSRNNIPVVRVDAANFTYFIHNETGAYVKVFTGVRGTLKSSADYFEHINQGLDTITYWGRAHGAGN